ncbi:MAG: hypothetical protein K2K94_10090 [Muribaculaceae bacterium]|nr:hypothetical protein [Muribaculaceae bacterium]
MFFKHNSLIIGLSLACIALPSCVDDKYDLSDVDTTVRVDVNELTLPIKLDEIKLESILKESDRVKIIDGVYTVVEDGNFESDPVYIEPVWIKSQMIPMPPRVKIPYVPGVATGDVLLEFTTPESEYNFSAKNLPYQITGIDAIGADLTFEFELTVINYEKVARKVERRDVVLQLPKGLTITDDGGGEYDPQTGELAMPTLNHDEYVKFYIHASRADFETMGGTFVPEEHKVEVNGVVNFKSGKLALLDLIENGPATEIQMVVSYSIPDFKLKTFSGGMKYDFEAVNFSDVRLDDMPDILNQPGTNLKIANPCIFLKVDNPMQSYGLKAQTGLTITAYHNTDATAYPIDNPYFTIGNDHADGVYTFCLSPKMPATTPEGFGNPEHVLYTKLSDVLSNAGDPKHGIPSYLAIQLNNPQIPDQTIVDMPIGQFIKEVRGKYEFHAPIALMEGSTIVYEETVTGWGSDEFDNFTITQLDVDAKLSCDIPIGLDIEAYPVDVKGNQIGNVEIEGARINAGSEPQDVHLHITGNIKGFDGIRYVAKATAGAGDEVLRTDMNIRVLNLRPTISGYYMKEL